MGRVREAEKGRAREDEEGRARLVAREQLGAVHLGAKHVHVEMWRPAAVRRLEHGLRAHHVSTFRVGLGLGRLEHGLLAQVQVPSRGPLGEWQAARAPVRGQRGGLGRRSEGIRGVRPGRQRS